ncbi:altered inheritance of mitochondria protein 21 [Hypomontagnella submonticulosa]|nr:altered inheritance of mitochondria protein 21 [Hypomontagnella submonticulosa]
MSMSTATMQSAPAVPPRPARAQERDNGSSIPAIPPRPVNKRLNRSVSPNPDRFAPSPLNESPFAPKSPRATRHSQTHLGEELERPMSVEMPNVGEEGREYAAALEELSSSPETSRRSSTAPEQTRTIGEDIKLYAPKPTMPAQSAKQRVAAVTRTDSERAAAFGIGRPSGEDQMYPGRTLKKKASTTSQLSHQSEAFTDEGYGIPEIGQRVPMLANAGDVQAPSPAPPRTTSTDGTKPARHHTRKTSSRNGFGDLPSDVYGLHGHGVASTDKLEKAYYEKHPDALQKERYNHLHDRVHDYSMSSEDLNKIVRDTASRGAGFGTSADYVGTPSEQVGYRAADEYTSRASRPPSTAPGNLTSPLKSSFTGPEVTVDHGDTTNDDDVIHVDDTDRHKGYVKFGNEQSAEGEGAEEVHTHPILAPDEVAKDPSPYQLQPAVEPPPERHGSVYEMEEPRSRPSSRPASVYSPPPPEMHSTPLEDVEEYEPLFPEDEKSGRKPMTKAEKLKEYRQRFPSRDIWEDAPNSVHSTAEVSTPELLEAREKEQTAVLDVPPREGETPAQAFARRQEELAEKEATNADSFLYRQQKPPSWASHQPHLAKEIQSRPNMAQRFPSRDIWEDTPDSLQYTATVSTPETTEEPQEDEGEKPTEQASQKPTIPARPKKAGSGDDSTSKPIVPDWPKPQIPARPSKPAAESKGSEAGVKSKPAVPARPVGGKIAALQAGFMSDLNNRLRLGPQAPKKEDPVAQEPAEEKDKAPLSDARKGRARGPQRRAPTKASSPSGLESGPPPVSNGTPVLSFSMTRTLFSIDEEGTMIVDDAGPEAAPVASPEAETKTNEAASEEPKEAKPQAPSQQDKPEATSEKSGDKLENKSANEDIPADSKPSETENESRTTEETKTLATNTAGESILEETIEKKPSGDEVREVEKAKDEVTE